MRRDDIAAHAFRSVIRRLGCTAWCPVGLAVGVVILRAHASSPSHTTTHTLQDHHAPNAVLRASTPLMDQRFACAACCFVYAFRSAPH